MLGQTVLATKKLMKNYMFFLCKWFIVKRCIFNLIGYPDLDNQCSLIKCFFKRKKIFFRANNEVSMFRCISIIFVRLKEDIPPPRYKSGFYYRQGRNMGEITFTIIAFYNHRLSFIWDESFIFCYMLVNKQLWHFFNIL